MPRKGETLKGNELNEHSVKVIGYLTSGYPTVDACVRAARWYAEGGCDMLEISLPLENNREKPFLSEIMKEAWRSCPDYDAHLASIARIARENPGVRITVLLYQEVLLAVGVGRFVAFCQSAGIRDVNSANLNDPVALAALREGGVRVAGLVTYGLDPARIAEEKATEGFIYCQAFPRPGQKLSPEADTVGKLIPYLRGLGIRGEIFCGGGIATPEDARQVVEAGADGFFLGSSIIRMYDEPDKLIAMIRSFRDAAVRHGDDKTIPEGKGVEK